MKRTMQAGIALSGLLLGVAVVALAFESGTNRSGAWIGEKIFDGRTGPWISEVRLVSPRAQFEEAKAAGKTPPTEPETYHFAFYVARLLPKTPILLREARGTVKISGPDGTMVTKNLTRMAGHLGADIALKKSGEYRFVVDVESSGEKGTTSFAHRIR